MSKLAILNDFTCSSFSPINKIGQIHHHFTKRFKSWHTCASTIKKLHGIKFINPLSHSGFWRGKKPSKNDNMGIPRQKKMNPLIFLINSLFPLLIFCSWITATWLGHTQVSLWRQIVPHWSALVWTGCHPLHATPGISPWIIVLPFLPGSLPGLIPLKSSGEM